MKTARKLLPLVVSLILLTIIARLAPWPEVFRALSQLHASTIMILLGLSTAFYATKAIRFWYMLKVLKISQPPDIVGLIYMAAQPVTLLPAGELYRSKAMETYRGVPMAKSVPTFTAQGIFEGIGLAAVAVIATIALGYQRLPALILLVLVAIGVWTIRKGYLAEITRVLNALPFVQISRSKLRRFSERNQELLRGRPFWVIMAMSVAIEIIGVAIAWHSVAGLGGSINLFHAALLYTLPVIVSFLSFLPGGVGASEQSAIGLLLLVGQSGAVAVAATLVMRASITGLGLVFGVLAWLWVKFRPTAVQGTSVLSDG